MKIEEQQEKCWFRTFSGRVIDPENLKPEDIDPIDIARSLSLQCRYGGQIVRFYSVAEHCINVMNEVHRDVLGLDKVNIPNLLLAALLHDASEAYMCDVPTPFKKLLPQYYELESKVMKVVHQRFNIKLDPWEEERVKEHDRRALDYEMPPLFNMPSKYVKFNLAYYTPDQAFSIFLNTLLRLEKENK
jgi:hypothetical protein